MSRKTVIHAALIGLVSCSLLSASDYYTGPIPLSRTDGNDPRTDLEKLEDRVDELGSVLADAVLTIQQQQWRVEELEAAVADHEDYLGDLRGRISISDTSMTLEADRINLNADRVDINADRTTVDGDLESDTLTTDSVDAESYTPGAGNIW